MPAHIDRRRQPQTTLKIIRAVLKEMDWPVKEIISHKTIHPAGKWQNETFGYALKIPRTLPITELWLGYLSHQAIKISGIYAGLEPELGENPLTPRQTGYRLSPDGFRAWLFLKELIPQAEIERLEYELSQRALKARIKEMLVKVYPFSLK